MKRFLLNSCFALSALTLSACGSSGSSNQSGQAEADSMTEMEVGAPAEALQPGAPWYEIEYFFAGDEIPSGACEQGRIRLDNQFNYTFTDCKGSRSGTLTQAQLDQLEDAWADARSSVNQKLTCEQGGISAAMTLSIQKTPASKNEVLRSFDSEKECARGSQEALVRLDDFMAALFNQFAR